jgi:hypothetical protein
MIGSRFIGVKRNNADITGVAQHQMIRRVCFLFVLRRVPQTLERGVQLVPSIVRSIWSGTTGGRRHAFHCAAIYPVRVECSPRGRASVRRKSVQR